MVPISEISSPCRNDESLAQFPESPAAEVFHANVQAVLGGRVVVRSERGVRLLQRGHLPMFFLPPSSLVMRHVRASDTLRLDDIGLAVHLSLFSGAHVARDGAWYYPGPDPDLAIIAGMVCLDPSRFDSVLLDGHRVSGGEQPGTWLTPNLRGYVMHRKGVA